MPETQQNQIDEKDEDGRIVGTEQKFDEFKTCTTEYNDILRIKKELVSLKRSIKLQVESVNETVDIINLYEGRKPTNKVLTEEELQLTRKLVNYQQQYENDIVKLKIKKFKFHCFSTSFLTDKSEKRT